MSTKFEKLMEKVGSGYGPEFEIDAEDLMLISIPKLGGVVIGSGRHYERMSGSTVSDEVREAFALLNADITPYKPEQADLRIAEYIDGGVGDSANDEHENEDTSADAPKYNIFDDNVEDTQPTKPANNIFDDNIDVTDNVEDAHAHIPTYNIFSDDDVPSGAHAYRVVSPSKHDNIVRDDDAAAAFIAMNDPAHVPENESDTSALVDPVDPVDIPAYDTIAAPDATVVTMTTPNSIVDAFA